MRPDDRISSFGTAAKYATLTRMYRIPTNVTANGAAIFNVRAGFLVSLRACFQSDIIQPERDKKKNSSRRPLT